jgi:hypothetical protein
MPSPRVPLLVTLVGSLAIVASSFMPGCGSGSSGNNGSGFTGSSGGSSDSGGGSDGESRDGSHADSSGGSGSSGGCGLSGCGDGATTSSSGSGGPMAVCPTGLDCKPMCMGGVNTTTISGKIYDPAKQVPLYNIAVYVPEKPLTALPQGVPTGADACNCSALFKSGAYVATATAVDGSFKLSGVPVGNNVPLVFQVGKWRREVMLNVTPCQDNPQPDKSLAFPGTLVGAGPNDSMPDIAVSTGGLDTLECLLARMGIPASEYVAGPGTTGHVHIFSGGGGGSSPESPPMMGAPTSWTDLWDQQAHLMPYDIVLLSCEGNETNNANPQVLEQYLNAGGRAFGSHYHYAWFAGPLTTMQAYKAPADWGTNLASWMPNTSGNDPIGGIIVQTLNGTTQPFAKGVALFQWLGINGALNPTNHQLPIFQPRFDDIVGPANKVSQPWIQAGIGGPAGFTEYFSFDTPVNAPYLPDGGAPNYCGRAVFSDVHVSGAQTDSNPPPTGCVSAPLSPQEKALEFMIFDLSSCVIPDTVPPSDAGVPIAQ